MLGAQWSEMVVGLLLLLLMLEPCDTMVRLVRDRVATAQGANQAERYAAHAGEWSAALRTKCVLQKPAILQRSHGTGWDHLASLKQERSPSCTLADVGAVYAGASGGSRMSREQLRKMRAGSAGMNC